MYLLRHILYFSFLCIALNAFADDEFLFESLKVNNPFKPLETAGNTVQKNIEHEDMQFQGVAFVEGKWIFSILNVKEKKSNWIALGESKQGIMAESYDSETQTLNLNISGTTYSLPIKTRDIPVASRQAANKSGGDFTSGNMPPPPEGGFGPGFRHASASGGFRRLSLEERQKIVNDYQARLKSEATMKENAAREKENKALKDKKPDKKK